MAAARRLIVNADDLGLCPSVNSAIFDAYRAGNLTSSTLMVNMPGTRDAAARLHDHAGLGVGLHFCLTEGQAVAGASSLTDARGAFLDRATLGPRCLRGQVRAVDIRREFEAQLDRAAELGVALTHSDSHQHVMMLPWVLDAVAPVIADRGLPIRLVQPPGRAIASAWRRPVKLVKQIANRLLAARHRRQHSLRTNAELVSIHDLDSAGPYQADTYRELVAAAGQGVVEVMVHPYLLGDDLRALYGAHLDEKMPFLQRCVAEHQALSGPPIFGGATLIDFSGV